MKLSIISVFIIYFIVLINTSFKYIPDPETLKSLQSIFLSVGSALIGSTAIIFSIILFTLQINHEKVPYGIFKKLSRDKKLFVSFGFTLILSILITIFSLVSTEWAYHIIQVTIIFVFLILSIFIYSYKRALKLINTNYQLEYIVKNSKDSFLLWSNNYEKLKTKNSNITKYDFFKNHPNWINEARQDIIYCNAYAKSLIQKNDYQTSEQALNSIVEINTYYIKVKDKAFIPRAHFSESMVSFDEFIEDTLEEIRQNIQDALSRNDERFILINFVILKKLHYLYSNIQYINSNGDRFASSLAFHYLLDGIEASIPRNIPNVLLQGVRLVSQIAQKEIIDGDSQGISRILKIISDLTCKGIVNKELSPITKSALEELSKITIELLLSKEDDTHFIMGKMNEYLCLIGKTEILSLDDSNNSFENRYYTFVSSKLIDFTNILINEDIDITDKEKIIKMIENIEKWSDSIRWENRELFQLALEHNSNFVHQLIDFISNISKCLMALSTLEIIDKKLSSNLKDNAQYLISIFTFIREDENTINLLESRKFMDMIFNLALNSYNYDLTDIAIEIRDILLIVGFRGQKVDDQNRILAKALGGSIYINILLDKNCDELLKTIREKLNKYNLTDKNRQDAIRNLQNMLNMYASSFSSIDKSLNSLEDRDELRNYIDAISELILNNGATNEKSNIRN